MVFLSQWVLTQVWTLGERLFFIDIYKYLLISSSFLPSFLSLFVMEIKQYHRHCFSRFAKHTSRSLQAKGLGYFSLLPIMAVTYLFLPVVKYGLYDSILWRSISPTESGMWSRGRIFHSDLRPRRTPTSRRFDNANNALVLSDFLNPCHQIPPSGSYQNTRSAVASHRRSILTCPPSPVLQQRRTSSRTHL